MGRKRLRTAGLRDPGKDNLIDQVKTMAGGKLAAKVMELRGSAFSVQQAAPIQSSIYWKKQYLKEWAWIGLK